MRGNVMSKAIRLAVTMGDPAGIGPEIVIKAAHKLEREIAEGRIELLVLGSAEALAKACGQLNVAADTLPLRMIDVGPVDGEVVTGQISAVGGEWACRAVKRATELVQAGEATGRACGSVLSAGAPWTGASAAS